MDKPTSAFETSGHVTPPTEEKVHVAAESEEIHSKTLDSGTRLPYNTGHGDFSFGRINNGHHYRSISCPLPRVPLESPYMSRDKFERNGQFPFFKLPYELRIMILNLLLKPLYDYTSTGKPYICLRLKNTPDPHIYSLPGERFSYSSHAKGLLSGSDHYEKEEALYEKLIEAIERKSIAHPTRQSAYELRVGTKRVHRRKSDGTWTTTGGPDYQYLELIRQLSNVSPLFRKELGDEVFSRVEVRTSTPYHGFGHLSSFLADRPVIHSGIKSLFFSMSLFMLSLDGKDAGTFEEFCKCVSRHLELEVCEVVLDVDENDVEEFLQGKGKYASLLAIRGFRVTQSFEIEVRFISEDKLQCGYIFDDRIEDYDSEDDSDDGLDDGSDDGSIGELEIEKKQNELWAKHKDTVRELLLPDTLRPGYSQPEPATEMQKYLSSQLQPQSTE